MVRGAVLKLRGRDVDNTLARTLRNQMDEAEKVLAAVPEAHAAADARLEVGRGPRHIEGDHALILVPDVDHAVDSVVLCLDMEGVKEVRPVCAQLGKCALHILVCLVFCEELLCRSLVDDAGRLPLLVLRIFAVAEDKHEGFRLTGLKRNMKLVGCDRVPAARNGVCAALSHDGLRCVGPVVGADEIIAARVERGDICIDGVERVVIASLSVLCLVIDCGAHNLDLAGAQVSLEVRHVVHRVPEAPLHIREDPEVLRLVSRIRNLQLLDLAGVIHRDKCKDIGRDAVLF